MALAAVAVLRAKDLNAWYKYTDALFDRQAEFFDDKVHDLSRSALEQRLAELAQDIAGVDKATFAANMKDDRSVRMIKDHTRFGRQNGRYLGSHGPTTWHSPTLSSQAYTSPQRSWSTASSIAT